LSGCGALQHLKPVPYHCAKFPFDGSQRRQAFMGRQMIRHEAHQALIQIVH
jgi:hypothetical protein